ncbi:ankyrin repeat-containing protein, partial [Trifolium medium]|nr:ankyrin repeat-containing protein [Trifolium medium]
YIQGIVPEYFKHKVNKDENTPGEIFKEEHENLLEKSFDWLKDTSQSCSAVAVLIVGLCLATSGNVPGGKNDSGGEPAFEGLAISSLIGLYSSGIAVIMFLAILTSRKQINDFDIILPAKLLVGLTTLFVSIVAMFISLCAGQFFVLTDKYAFVIY